MIFWKQNHCLWHTAGHSTNDLCHHLLKCVLIIQWNQSGILWSSKHLLRTLLFQGDLIDASAGIYSTMSLCQARYVETHIWKRWVATGGSAPETQLAELWCQLGKIVFIASVIYTPRFSQNFTNSLQYKRNEKSDWVWEIHVKMCTGLVLYGASGTFQGILAGLLSILWNKDCFPWISWTCLWEAHVLRSIQCFFFSVSISYLTPKIVYFLFLNTKVSKKHFIYFSKQKYWEYHLDPVWARVAPTDCSWVESTKIHWTWLQPKSG